MRRNHSTLRRAAPSPMIILIGIGVFLALISLVLWHRPASKEKSSELTLSRATVEESGTEQSVDNRPANNLRRLHATLKGSLPYTVQRAIGRKDGPILAALAARLVIWKLDIRKDLRRGDQLEILYYPVDTQSRFEIEAMVYKSRKFSKTYHFYRYQERSRAFRSYYDDKGNEVELKLGHSPMRRYDQITSILKMRPKHKGVDFKAPEGTPIHLPWRSRVVRRTWNARYNGNCVEVVFLHDNRRVHAKFLHLQKLMPIVKRGRILREGTVIGLVGNTGRSTAPHLHYQLEGSKRRVVDPYKYHPTFTRSLPSAEKKLFHKKRLKLERQLTLLGRSS